MKFYYPSKCIPIGNHLFGEMNDPDVSTDPTVPAKALLILEPEIVDPKIKHYSDQYNTVLSFYDINSRNCILYTMRLPVLWPELTYSEFLGNNTRPNNLVSIMGNKYRHRIIKVNDLHKSSIKNNIHMDLYGTPKWDHPCYHGKLEFNNKRNTLIKYKYCYCPENSYYPRYLTEKLPEAILSGCLPIVDHIQDIDEYPYIPWEFVSTSLEEAQTKDHSKFLECINDTHQDIIQGHSTTRMLDDISSLIVEEIKK